MSNRLEDSLENELPKFLLSVLDKTEYVLLSEDDINANSLQMQFTIMDRTVSFLRAAAESDEDYFDEWKSMANAFASVLECLNRQNLELSLRPSSLATECCSVERTGKPGRPSFYIPFEMIEDSRVSGKNCTSSQGIFMSLDVIDNLFSKSPLEKIVIPDRNQTVYLLIFYEITGGKQTGVANFRQLRRQLLTLRYALKDFLYILDDLKVQISATQRWVALTKQFLNLVNKVRSSIRNGLKSVSFIKQSKKRFKEIESRLIELKIIVNTLISSLKFKLQSPAISDLLTSLADVRDALPDSLKLLLRKMPVRQSLQTIQLKHHGTICVKRLCFEHMNITTEVIDRNGCRKLHFTSPSSKDETSVLISGVATRNLQLGTMLKFSKLDVLSISLRRYRKELFSNFQSTIHFWGFSKNVNVELTLEKLSIPMEARLYNRYHTAMNLTATVKSSDWNSLVFSVRGRMNKSSELVTELDSLANNYTLQIVQTAVKRVRNVEMASKNAKKREAFFKSLIIARRKAKANLMLRRTETEKAFHDSRLRHASATMDFNTSFWSIQRKIKPCLFQDCKYLKLSECIPKICQKENFVSYKHQTCVETTNHIVVEKYFEVKVQANYENAFYRDSCDSHCSFLWFVGCNYKCERVHAGVKTTLYDKVKNVLREEWVPVTEFECKTETRKKSTGFNTAYKCCNQNMKSNITVLDPKCVLENEVCLRKKKAYQVILEAENRTLFSSYTEMMKWSETVSTLQMNLDKMRIQLQRINTEQTLIEARLRQQQYSVDAIEIKKVKNRERKALDLGHKLNQSSVKKLVNVRSIEFNTSFSSKEKTSFPVRVVFDSVNGHKRLPNVFLDFKNINLEHIAKEIAKIVIGDENLKRRKRALQQDTQTVDKREYFRTSCLLSRNTMLFFADIVKSLSFEVKMNERFNNMHQPGKQLIKRTLEMLTSKYSPNEVRNSSMLRSYIDVIDLHKTTTKDRAEAWNQTLSNWRGLVDTFPVERGISYCTGASDCIDVLSDELLQMYDNVDDPKSIQLKQIINALKEQTYSLITQNYSVAEAHERLNRLQLLLAKSNDIEVLCGELPFLVSVSPRTLAVLEGADLMLDCKANSSVAVLYTWYKGRNVFQVSENGSLWLQNITSTDAGAYKCVASNHIGNVSSNYTIFAVESRPVVLQHPSNETLIMGIEKPLFIVCNVTGKPIPNITWFFMPANSSVTRVVKNKTETFFYKEKFNVNDTGYYFCEASNKHGMAQSKTARIDVLNGSIGDPRMFLSVNITLSNSSSYYPLTAKLFFREMNKSARFLKDFAKAIQIEVSYVTKLSFKVYFMKNINIMVVINRKMVSKKNLPISSVDSVSIFSRERIKLGKIYQALRKRIAEETFIIPANGFFFKAALESLKAGLLTQKCPPGQYSHQNGYLCVNCPAGSYSQEGEKCKKCARGTYQPEQGHLSCIPCARGFTTPHSGSVTVSSCYFTGYNCSTPQPPSYAFLRYPMNNRTSFKKGAVITWSCLSGYDAVGNTQQECLGPDWSNRSFHCRASCPDSWEKFTNSCYIAFTNLTARMSEARAGCHRMGAELVDILSKEENAFVQQYARKTLRKTYIWLGLQRDQRRRFNKWFSGKPLQFQNWFYGEPNDYDKSEGCALMYIGQYRSGWNDVSCYFDHKPSFVCKKPKQ